MSTTLITRETAGGGATVKDAPLTNAEIDSNFISLADNKLEASSNLADLTDTTAAKANLDLATLAFQNSDDVDITGGTIVGITDLAVADGGTGASDPASARANLELGSVATLDTGSGISQIRINSDNENFFVTIDSNQIITGVKEFTEYTDFSGSSAIKVPVGNNIQRPTVPVAGQVRFNTVTGAFEGNYDGTIGGWGALGGPGSGTTTFLDVFPIGAIALWSGSITNIPEGWQLCDGSNGAPDLRDRFVVGAGGDYSVDSTGGSADAVVVAHTHTGNTASAGDHAHTGNTSNTGGHSHTGNTSNNGNHRHGFLGPGTGNRAAGNVYTWSAIQNRNTNSAGAHSHNISTNNTGNHSHTISTDTTGAHTHSVSVSSTGESGTDKNLPPYYALAYIIKLTETIGQLIPENLAGTIDTIENTLGTVVNDVDSLTASDVDYDNTTTGIVATNTQAAIDETYERADTFVANDERVKTAVNATGDQPIYAVRAWVNFDGVNVTIRGSGNVSSVTRTSSGRHTVNFTEPMPDTNYSAAASTDALDTSNARILSVRSYTTSSISTVVTNESGTAFTIDAGTISVQVVR